jgi:hypothetical protein
MVRLSEDTRRPGHQTEEMARRYQHLRPDKLKDAILALGT